MAGCSIATETPYNQGVDAYQTEKYEDAVTYWSKSAASGDIDAMNNLAYLHFNGLGTVKDQQKAIELWNSAAMQGQSEAQSHLAAAYSEGLGVPKSVVKAYAWYRCTIASAEGRASTEWSDLEEQIADAARESLVRLTDVMTMSELEDGRTLASDYIQKYSLRASEQRR